MRVLVTGAGGFLGYEVAKRLAARDDVVIAVDAEIRADLGALASSRRNVVAVEADIGDMATLCQVFREHKPQAVLHFAAIVGVPASLGSAATILQVNVQGSLNVLDAMRLFDVRRIVHLSSEEVYGDFRAPVADEEHPQSPLLPYGITKLAVEHFGRTYASLYGLECINVRTSWVYGVRLDRPRPPMNYLNAALLGEELALPAGADTLIDYTYVEDLVDGVLRTLDHPRHRFDTYNVASGEATSDRDMVQMIKELLPGARISVGPGRREFRPGIRIPAKGALDCTRARIELGYVPKYPLRRGLAAYIDAWRAARPMATA